ncbi:MAG: dTDP-glucose pyrophosphorylase [Nitrospirae bacterium]|nr:dTDP-glucose pyrophosphorylase [Nitrospirota bacterium]
MREVIGLVPAAGTASRIAPLPCSKELYPIGFRSTNNGSELRPKVVTHYLLESLRSADVTKAYIILREGKWDIPKYFGDGKMIDMDLAYLMMDSPYGVPFTLDQAYPFVKDALVALGFPDIIFEPDDAYRKLFIKQTETNADIVLGLFPTLQKHKTDMVELDERGTVCAIHIKPETTKLVYSWEIAVWTPAFTKYMHDYIAAKKENIIDFHCQKELFVGDVIQAAIRDDMYIESVIYQNGNCIDIGTPEDMVKAAYMSNRVLKDNSI